MAIPKNPDYSLKSTFSLVIRLFYVTLWHSVTCHFKAFFHQLTKYRQNIDLVSL